MIKQLKYSKKIPSNSNWLLPVVRWPLLNPRCQCKPTKNQKNQVKTIIFCTLFYNSFVSIKQSAVALLSTNLLLQPFQSTKWTIKASNHLFLCWRSTLLPESWPRFLLGSPFSQKFVRTFQMKSVFQFHDFRVVFCHNVSLNGER